MILSRSAYPHHPFGQVALGFRELARVEKPNLSPKNKTESITNFGLQPLFLPNFFSMPSQYYLFLSLALFCIGVMGVLMRRNAIIILMCIELMLNAVNLLMVTFSKMHNHADAQIFVFFIMVVAAAEVSVGLSVVVLMYRKTHSIDVNILNRLKN